MTLSPQARGKPPPLNIRITMSRKHDNAIHCRTWGDKFRDALRGLKRGVRGQSSFSVHFFMAAAVIAAAAVLKAELWEWCVLLLCITVVLTAEMLNTAIEFLAKAVREERNPHIGAALDTASAAVLVASIGAAIVGAAVFIHKLWPMLS